MNNNKYYELEYYYNNRDKILNKLKEKHKNLTNEEIEKRRIYQRNYYNKIRKQKFADELKNTGSNYRTKYYEKNRDVIVKRQKDRRKKIKDMNTIIMNKKNETNIIDLS